MGEPEPTEDERARVAATFCDDEWPDPLIAEAQTWLQNVGIFHMAPEPTVGLVRRLMQALAASEQRAFSMAAGVCEHRSGNDHGNPMCNATGQLIETMGTTAGLALKDRPRDAGSGWFQTVPVEPEPGMIEAGVNYALQVNIDANYPWPAYIRDLWIRMLDHASTHTRAVYPYRALVKAAQDYRYALYGADVSVAEFVGAQAALAKAAAALPAAR